MKRARFKSEIRTEWKKIAVVGLGGILFGFGAGASNRALTHHAAHRVIYVEGSQAQSDDTEEAAKLQARNRRLRVFFDVLRQRARARGQQQTGSGE